MQRTVAAGQVAIEGFLKMQGTYKVRIGALWRRVLHASIIGDMNWIPIEVGLGKRHTAEEWTQNFLQHTTLPPAGVLQSSSSVIPLLRIDLLAPSDTPVDVGSRPTTRRQEAAVDATGMDGAGSGQPGSKNTQATAAAAAVAQASWSTSSRSSSSSSSSTAGVNLK